MQKGIIAALVLSLFFISQTEAQLLKSFGAKLAYTSSGQEFDYSSAGFTLNPDRRNGFGVGLYAEWLNLPIVSVVTEVDYVQRGMVMEYPMTGPESPAEQIGTIMNDNRLDYLSIPILAKATVPMGLVSPYVIAGPRIDLLLGHNDESISYRLLYENFKKTSMGGTVGAGAQLNTILPIDLLLEFRYNFYFTDTYKTDLLKIRNNAFDVWVGVGI